MEKSRLNRYVVIHCVDMAARVRRFAMSVQVPSSVKKLDPHSILSQRDVSVSLLCVKD